MQNSLHRLDHTNFFFFTTPGRSQKHMNGHGSGGHSSAVSTSTPTSFLLLWAIFFSMFMANIWLRKDRLLVFSITCWYGDTALLPITTWPWRKHILHRMDYPVRQIRQVNPREWKCRRRRNQQNIFFFFDAMGFRADQTEMWEVDQRGLTSLESILASSLALRMRLTIHLSASSGVMLSLSASMLRERGSAGGWGGEGEFSVEKTSFGAASKDVAFFKRSSNMSKSQEHRELKQQRNIHHLSTADIKIYWVLFCFVFQKKTETFLFKWNRSVFLTHEWISRMTNLMLMHWWIRQNVSKMKRRAFSMKSSRQATKKKSLTRTWMETKQSHYSRLPHSLSHTYTEKKTSRVQQSKGEKKKREKN